MKNWTHQAQSADGTMIKARALGNGPPLVFVHGALDDGDLDWAALTPSMAEDFTCYVMSTRGRGASEAAPDYSASRRVEDVVAVAESVGGPVGLVGLSGGGALVLGAAAESDAVRGVGAYEPAVLDVADDELRAGFKEAVERMHGAADQGRMAEAARIFLQGVTNEEEFAALERDDSFEKAGRNVPVDLREFAHAFDGRGPSPTEASTLRRISVPVLILLGERTPLAWFRQGARFGEEHIADCRILEIEGAGHLGPVTHPKPVGRELIRFFRQVVRL